MRALLAFLSLQWARGASAQPFAYNISSLLPQDLNHSLASIGQQITSLTLEDAWIPLEAWTARNGYIYRNGTELMLNGVRWTGSGANVYWLGLDENVHPPKGEPFYAPFNASYPTRGRITEATNVLNTHGARTIRSQTLGVSVGNPLSLMPKLGHFNDKPSKP